MTDAVSRLAAVSAATSVVSSRLEGRRPTVAVVLGSGLGHVAERVQDAIRIPYGVIPGFHVPTVVGHKGELVAGRLADRDVIVQSGRFHMYEGHSADEAVLPVRLFASLGVDTLVVTNAAGGINPGYGPGTIMLIRDHLNLTGRTPLLGAALPGEERFPDMTVAYDAGLRDRARALAVSLGIPLEEGVYAGLLGPSYETPAEVAYLERIGADAVGMSTVMEVIAARARGMRVAGFSTVTNAAAGQTGTPLSHAEVMEVAAQVGERLGVLIEGVLAGG
ncbi:MAG: purine-nucleoside phosphorylase [Gemmatimonadota bacterium]|jgi:purine-nucleoside phosphorylase|nr:purine-nucleoside phosphorylase [Gemmatimonadota bacterium]